jgi:hypothetical protein
MIKCAAHACRHSVPADAAGILPNTLYRAPVTKARGAERLHCTSTHNWSPASPSRVSTKPVDAHRAICQGLYRLNAQARPVRSLASQLHESLSEVALLDVPCFPKTKACVACIYSGHDALLPPEQKHGGLCSTQDYRVGLPSDLARKLVGLHGHRELSNFLTYKPLVLTGKHGVLGDGTGGKGGARNEMPNAFLLFCELLCSCCHFLLQPVIHLKVRHLQRNQWFRCSKVKQGSQGK